MIYFLYIALIIIFTSIDFSNGTGDPTKETEKMKRKLDDSIVQGETIYPSKLEESLKNLDISPEIPSTSSNTLVAGQEELKKITLNEELKKYADVKTKTIEELRNLLLQDKTILLPEIPSNEKLFMFLYSRYYNIEKAKTVLQNSYSMKQTAPKLFKNRDISDEMLRNHLKNNIAVFMLNPNPSEMDRILFFKLLTNDRKKFNFVETLKLILMAYESSFYLDGTAINDVIFVDIKHIGVLHIGNINIEIMRQFVDFAQKALPVRRKLVCILNANLAFVIFYNSTIKLFLDQRFVNLIKFDKSKNKKSDIFCDYVPKERLPQEYGSSNHPISYYSEQFIEILVKLKKFFVDDEKLIYGNN